MSEKPRQVNRIPFEEIEGQESVNSWSLPTMDQPRSRTFKSAKREKNKPNPANGEIIEDYNGSVKPKPLTAEDLKQLAETATAEGFQCGHSEGMAQGLQEGRLKGEKEGQLKAYKETKAMLDSEIKNFKSIASNLLIPMQDQEQVLEKIIVDMAFRFAQTLLDSEIQQTPDRLFSIVNKALAALPAGSKNISVFVNQADAELIEKYLPPENRSWSVKVDDLVTCGGCRVETLESLVDYTVQSRLDNFITHVEALGEKSNADIPDILPEIENFEVKESEEAETQKNDPSTDSTETKEVASVGPEKDIEVSVEADRPTLPENNDNRDEPS